ncbi:MAG: hypothetical protein DRN08_08025 [Thermoplasmata archaeon]|nr:MAG: hypothetical protein DRN08_08025 [Thermoplasmata archaeon]
MILVDIGNTTLHFGIERYGSIIKDFRVYKKNFSRGRLKSILRHYPNQDIVVCSVAPSVLKYFKKAGRKVYIIGKDIKVPIKSSYNKEDIGQDRLVNAFAAKNIYPDAKIIIDCGTAITIDILSKKGNYLGGFILPGINLYLDSLNSCELLSGKFMVKKTYRFIPKNTQESISAGLQESFPLMINGVIRKYKEALEERMNFRIKVIITGGESTIVLRKLNFPYIYDSTLTLKGLFLLKKIP